MHPNDLGRLGAVLLLASTLSLAACDATDPSLDTFETAATADARAKTAVCHRSGSDANPYVRIEVGAPAVAAHHKHGDALPGEAVPGTGGAFVFDAACVPQDAVVEPPPPTPAVPVVAGLTCPTAPLLTGEAGTFTGSVNDDATGEIDYAFDFNTDGTTDATGNLEETEAFSTAGTYTVTFTATGPENFSLASCQVQVVDPVVPVVASVSCPATIRTGETGTFTGSVNADATGPIFHRLTVVTLSNGDYVESTGQLAGTSKTVSYPFNSPGVRRVTFTARGPENTDSATCDVTVTDPVVGGALN